MSHFLKKLAFKVIPNAREKRDGVVAELFRDCGTVLDIGSGEGINMQFFKGHKDGVEVYPVHAEELRRSGEWGIILELDARNLSSIPSKSYDGVACFHLIEHLSKIDGLLLIKEMERIARTIVVIETPNGYLPQDAIGGNEFQRHLSGWESYEFELLGYFVLGLFGHKRFKNTAVLKHLTDKFIRSRPRASFVLLASKVVTN